MLTILKAGSEFIILDNVKFVEDASNEYPAKARANVYFIDGSRLRFSDLAAFEVLEYLNTRKAVNSLE